MLHFDGLFLRFVVLGCRFSSILWGDGPYFDDWFLCSKVPLRLLLT